MMYPKIPAELKAQKQWCLYRKKWLEEKQKYTKLPVNAFDGSPGRSNDPDSWADYETAINNVQKFNCDGIGFYFGNGYVGLDIDSVLEDLEEVAAGINDPSNLIIRARELTDYTYCELSMSKTGIHCIFKGEIPGERRRKGNFEMYEDGRFFALTGMALEENSKIKPLDKSQMDELYKFCFGQEKIIPTTNPVSVHSIDLSVDEIIEKALASKNGTRFKLLYEGGWEQFYTSQSEADMAFANDLAFWCGKDTNKMDIIFRNSSLMREKYDTKRGKTSYGTQLLSKACKETANVFQPQKERIAVKYNLNFLNEDKEEAVIIPRSWDDMGNAQRFVDLNGKNFRYSYIDKRWYAYNGSYWDADSQGLLNQAADAVIERMTQEEPMAQADIDLEKFDQSWHKFIKKSRSAKSKRDMLSESQHHLPILPDEFDCHKMLLNTVNGYVDLTNGKLSEDGRRELMFSQQTNVEYSDNADCPMWKEFLQQIFLGDSDLIRFMQKALGYALTGSIEEQKLFVLFGNGRNGKSVFLDVISHVMGNYVRTMNSQSIMVKQGSGVNSDIARLKSARIVISSEANEGERLDEGLIKQLTGGDKIVARFLYGAEFEFSPQFKLFMATNHKPLIRGTDEGIWRRIMLIPFNLQIPKEKVDRHLTDKLKREASGILNWMVEGSMLWQSEGLEPPQSVLDQVAAYRTEMDVVTRFIEECCEVSFSNSVKTSELYKNYKAWCEINSEYCMSNQKFGREIMKKFNRRHTRQADVYDGLSIKTDSDPRFNFLR